MDTGTTAFMLCCIIGLTVMIPGLALFYGGMVSVKSSTNMMMMTFGAVAIVGVLWMLFATAWAILVYFPVAHWVFAFDGVVTADSTGGWIANKLKAIDFAGGTAVHINSGTAGLVLALILGKRLGWPTTPMRPHNLPFTML